MSKAVLIVVVLISVPSFAASRVNIVPFAQSERPTVSIVADDASRTVLRVSVPTIGVEAAIVDGGTRTIAAFPGSGTLFRPGAPDVPTYGTLVVVPPSSGVAARVRVLSETVVPVGRLVAVPNADDSPAAEDESIYGRDEFYPAESEVHVGEPAIMAGVRVVSVSFAAARYNPVRGEMAVADEFEIELDYSGVDATNSIETRRALPRSMAEMIAAFAPNYGGMDWGNLPMVDKGSVIYLTKSTYVPFLQPLVDWRREQGYNVIVQDVDALPGGNNQTTIDSWIQNQYNSYVQPLEAVVLVGDEPGSYGPVDYPYSSYASDHQYARNQGTDYLADVYVGRMSVQTTSQLATLVAKMLAFEQSPHDVTNGWLQRGLGCAYFGGGNFVSARTTVMWARERMLANEYAQVDTVFASWGGGGTAQVIASINNGVDMIFYRGYGGYDGWWGPDFTSYDISALTNYWRTGIMASIVCGNGEFDWSECMGETWIRVGSPSQPTGGVAFSGYSDGFTHTVWNNPVLMGYAWALVDEGLTLVGQSFLAGKTVQYDAFPLNRSAGGWVEHYHHIYNLLGDPLIPCWTTNPKIMQVVVPDTLATGETGIDVRVMEGADPVVGAYVSLLKGAYPGYETRVGSSVDSNGWAHLPITLATPGGLTLTVTAKNYLPHRAAIPVVDAAVALTYQSSSQVGPLSPGTSPSFDLTIRNVGVSVAATGITGTLTALDPYVAVVVGGPVAFPDALPGADATSLSSFQIAVSSDIPPAYPVRLGLALATNEGAWNALVPFNVSAPGVRVASTTVVDPNFRLDPGETATLSMTVQNTGNAELPACEVRLRSSDQTVSVVDSVGALPVLGAGVSASLLDSFVVSCSASAYNGHVARLEIVAFAGAATPGAAFDLSIGTVHTYDPGGPTAYGYYCYDNTDTASGRAPSYEWVDIHTIGTNLYLGDDQTVKRAIPVDFVYHGVSVDTISISSNGFIIPDTSTFAGFYNRGFPFPENDAGMIAPFWDDLTTSGSYNVYVYHDAVNQRYIVEWYNVYHTMGIMPNLRFACYIYDASARPTPTGDSEIEFHYNNILNLDSYNNIDYVGNYASVGIMSYDREDGFTYTFANQYHPSCPVLANNRAIKFTTVGDPIVSAPGVPAVPAVFFLAQNFPNPFNPATSISFDLPRASDVRLEVFDVLGRAVATLVDGAMPAGRHTVAWDASGLASGVYFARLATDADSAVRKMVLLK